MCGKLLYGSIAVKRDALNKKNILVYLRYPPIEAESAPKI